jgi:hypothetical protein
MKSNKQKRTELKARNESRREAAALAARRAVEQKRRDVYLAALKRGEIAVNPDRLAPTNSYSEADFVLRGTYRPVEFVCAGCGAPQVWTPRQQKWWYEIAQGDRFSTAKLCRPCRAKERARKTEARRVSGRGGAEVDPTTC